VRKALGLFQLLRRAAIVGIVGWIVVLPVTLWVYDRHKRSQLLPALRAHVERCEALPVFRATHAPWFAAEMQ
jgi:glutathione S-transferase